MGRSFVQSSPMQGGVSECGLGTSTMTRRTSRAVEPWGGGNSLMLLDFFICEAILGLLKNVERGMLMWI
jgi:hypothetical protein